ncbi:MAG: DUF3228 family protein [Candidatus Neomarinimicrobiota bacterium]
MKNGGEDGVRRLVAVNDFVRRQVAGSGKTYAIGLSFEEIAQHAEKQLLNDQFRVGYRDGIVLVNVASELVPQFVSPWVRIDESTELTARVVIRRAGEEPYIRIRARSGQALPAGKVELVLYRKNVLAENNENSTGAEWELISINAVPEGLAELPMGPVTMMRNQLELPGGTAARYSSEQWVESVRFWQYYAALEPADDKIEELTA